MMYMSKTPIDDLLTDPVLCSNIAKIEEPLRGIINVMLTMLRVPAAELDNDLTALNILRAMIASIEVTEGVVGKDDLSYHRIISVTYENLYKNADTDEKHRGTSRIYRYEERYILDIVTEKYKDPKLSPTEYLALSGEALARFLNYFSYVCGLVKTECRVNKLNSTKTIELMHDEK